MAYTPYYAPYTRPMGYYNPSIPQENTNMQSGQQFQQMPIQQQMPMQQPIQQMPMAQPAPTNDMLWVLGQTEAESYLVAPNNSVTLWDKNKDTVYIKSVNAQGVPSMRILDYTERNTEKSPETPQKHVCKCGDKFATIDTVNALRIKIESLESELEELKSKPKTKTAKKAVEEVEEDNG